jgi:50S ribosomal subunit-associated GTPase HflX
MLILSRKLKGQVKVILIVGPTGAGKTSLVKLFTDEDVLVGHKLESGIFTSNPYQHILTDIYMRHH